MLNNSIQLEYEKITKAITSDSESFKAFLKYSARIYKYPFDTALIAYSQCPKATMLATYDIWNKVGRHVNRGERSITIEILSDKYPNKKIHLFDVSQTSGNTLPHLWVLNSDNRTQLLNKLNDGIENKYDNIEDYIKSEINAGLQGGIHDFGNNKLTDLVYQSTLLTVNSRCGIDISKISNQPFKYLGNLKDMESVWTVCREINLISHNILKNVETKIKSLNDERGNEYVRAENDQARTNTEPSLYREGRNQVVAASRTEGQQTTQSLGQTSSSLYAGNQSDKSNDTEYERRINANSSEGRDRSNGENGQSSGSAAQTISGSEWRGRLHETGSALLLDSEHSGGDSAQGDSERSSLTTENIKHEELPQDSSFIMPKSVSTAAEVNAEIEKVLFDYGSGFQDGKQRIYEFFIKNSDLKERTKFLKKEYGIGGYHRTGFDFMHTGKGLSIKFDEKNIDKKLTYTETAKIIAGMIEDGRYLETQTPKPRVEQGQNKR